MYKKTTIFTLTFVFLFVNTQLASATLTVDNQGRLFSSSNGRVLGNHDDDDNPSQSTRNTGNDSQNNETDEESLNPGQARKAEASANANSNAPNNRSSIDSQETEEATTTKGKPNKVKIIPGQEKLQLRYETESGEEVIDEELETETDVVEIQEPEYKNRVSVRSKDNASYVIKNKIAAKSNFPLQVNLDTNELIVTTPKGSKTVTVLPDKAVENMLAANVLDQLGGKGGLIWLENQSQATQSGELDDDEATQSGELDDDDEATQSGDLEDEVQASESADLDEEDSDEATPSSVLEEPQVAEEADTVVELDESEDGTLVYKITGSKFERLLGIRRVQLNRTAIVSAQTGELLDIQQDFRTDLLDLISF